MESSNMYVNLQQINFDNFSASPHWVGYFQIKNLQNLSHISLIAKASQLVLGYFGEDLADFFLMSALASDGGEMNNPEFGEEDLVYAKLLELAKDKGFIQPYNEAFQRYYEKEQPLPANLLNFHFQPEFFMPFCEVLMAYYFSIVGQICFLINPKLQIALYPHDDIGFGCISLNGNLEILKEFLQYCDLNQNFESVIKILN